MDSESARAIYTNLFILARADGNIDPAERQYLSRFAAVAGIDEASAASWRDEVESGSDQFRPVSDAAAAGGGLAVLARMVRVDGEFGAEEQAAYLNLGKALGWGQEELGAALREYWDRDPLEALEASVAKSTSAAGGAKGLAVSDDMGDREALLGAAGSVALEVAAMSDLDRVESTPALVVFHVAEERSDSGRRLQLLGERFSGTPVAFVARRDQAPQIGFLLERGAARCFVEPLYTGEIEKAFGELLDS